MSRNTLCKQRVWSKVTALELLEPCMGIGLFPICSAGKTFGATTSGEKQRRMSYKEMFWMACDSTEQLRAEYGPFHTRAEAEQEAVKLGFGYLLRYEHVIGDNEDIKEVRCIFIELECDPGVAYLAPKLHTRCATCGESSVHDHGWPAEA